MRLLSLAIAVATLAACSPQASRTAEATPPVPVQAAAPTPPPQLSDEWLPPKEKGLPMWVVRDADSTIYLTGTVHALPPDTPWKSEKLKAALKEADEVWLEIAMTDRADLQKRAAAVMQTYAKASVPLSSLLNEKERAALSDFAKANRMTPEQEKRLDGMKPWAVTNAISASSMSSAGFNGDAGIDGVIAADATKLGTKVNGLETIEFQASVLAAESDASQLQELRMLLAVPKTTRDRMFTMMTPSFIAWANGDTRPMTSYFTFVSLVSNLDPRSKARMDRLLKGRNENWAGQIEEMLKGSGTAFIAVGGGHLIGPDNLRALLEARGINVDRY